MTVIIAFKQAKQDRAQFEKQRQDVLHPLVVRRGKGLSPDPSREDVAKLLADEVRGIRRVVGKRK